MRLVEGFESRVVRLLGGGVRLLGRRRAGYFSAGRAAGLAHARPATDLTPASRIPLPPCLGRPYAGAEPGKQHKATDDFETHSTLRQAGSRDVRYFMHAAQF